MAVGAPATWLACSGCGYVAPADRPFVARCPERRPGDDIDHVMTRRIDPAQVDREPDPDPNPFVRYRTRFHAWHVARAAGWSDVRYVDLVRRLDDAIAAVDGHGFLVTPLVRSRRLDDQLRFDEAGGAWIKDETGNVSGSHKARHLMGVMLELQVSEAVAGLAADRPLAIASCGNAALAAAVVARAAGRRLLVFVPPHAEPPVLDRLAALDADVTPCPRLPGEAGDPSYLRLQEAIAAGAIPFTCQGNENGLVIEGGATLSWELIDQLHGTGVTLDRIVIQVGGGALAAAQALAFEEALAMGIVERRPRLDTVQTRGGWPLARAYERVVEELGIPAGAPADESGIEADLAAIARRRSRYMWPWETEPHSVASGILDDETYDWRAVVRAMLISGGRPVVVDEAGLIDANDMAATTTGIGADHTGTAGLAGLLELVEQRVVGPAENVGLVFSGARRDGSPDP